MSNKFQPCVISILAPKWQSQGWIIYRHRHNNSCKPMKTKTFTVNTKYVHMIQPSIGKIPWRNIIRSQSSIKYREWLYILSSLCSRATPDIILSILLVTAAFSSASAPRDAIVAVATAAATAAFTAAATTWKLQGSTISGIIRLRDKCRSFTQQIGHGERLPRWLLMSQWLLLLCGADRCYQRQEEESLFLHCIILQYIIANSDCDVLEWSSREWRTKAIQPQPMSCKYVRSKSSYLCHT